MKNRMKFIAITSLALVLLAGCSQTTPPSTSADIVLQDGKIYTVNQSAPWAESVAIKDGRIIYVGNDEGMSKFKGDNTRVVSLNGKMVMPGITDTHIHALGTTKPDMCDLDTKPFSLDDMVPLLRNCITQYDIKPGEKLSVLQWSFSVGNQPSAKYPTLRAALDGVSTQHSVILSGDDGHHSAYNSFALSQARDKDGNVNPINKETLKTAYKDYASMISVDAKGEPTGGISETARNLIQSQGMEEFTFADTKSQHLMPRVAKELASVGVTSVFDPFVGESVLGHYDWLEKSGHMTFRARLGLVPDETPWISDPEIPMIPKYVEDFKAKRKRFENSKYVRVDAVKLFADAVLEGNPFTDPPTMPVSAMLNGFLSPQYDFDLEAETLNSLAYIDRNSDVCKSVIQNPEQHSGNAVVEKFRATNGFVPSQCMPYKGILEHQDGYISAFTQQMTDAGFNVHIHAIGDTAVRKAADAFEAAKPSADAQGLSQSIVHMQVIHPDDQKRLGDLGVFASFTFLWNRPEVEYDLMVVPFIDEVETIEDMYSMDNYYIQNVYPAKSLIDHGAIVMGGSDAPVGSRDPLTFASIEQAISRSNGQFILNPDERIDIHQAIAAYTINGAKFFGNEDNLGTIETGKLADLIVLDRNIVELAESGYEAAVEIAHTQVEMTIFDGKIIYEMSGE